MKQKKRHLKLSYEQCDDIKISVASTYEELVAAHRLCYSVYLAEGYTAENMQQMRLSLHHSLPTTTTFIATHKGRVIGTLMAIADGPLGLPSDNFYDLKELKQKYGRLVEGSGYAIHKDFRGASGHIFFMLYKYFFKFVDEFLAADCVVAAINPKQKDFYNKVLLFEDFFKDVVPAKSANGAPAVLLTLDLNFYRDKYLIAYGNFEKEKNLYHYMFEYQPKNFFYPKKKSFLAGYPTITPEIFKKVFTEEWPLFNYLSSEDIQTLRDIYAFHEYDDSFISPFLVKEIKPRRMCRFSSKAFLEGFNGVRFRHKALIKDVSERGLLVKFQELPELLDFSPRYANVDIGGAEFDLQIQPIWRKNLHVGFQILNPPKAWLAIIRSGQFELIFKDAGDCVLSLKVS